jgi:predicted nucleic acid-binding protein
MEQSQYLIDTNVVIDYLGQKLPTSGMEFVSDVIDNISNVSAVTKIEVLGFNAPSEHYQVLIDFMNDSTIWHLTDNIIDVSIEVRKKHKTKLPDAIIAATALVHGLIIVSRNVKDFQNIDGPTCVNPHDL